MIKELIVENSTAQRTFFEGGYVMEKEDYDHRKLTKGRYSRGQKVLAFVFDEEKDGQKKCSARIYDCLEDSGLHRVGDRVEGIVYQINKQMGAFVAVEDRYHGLIPLNEMYNEVVPGHRLEARVTRINEGKLRLSVRPSGREKIADDTELLYEELRRSGGEIFLTDDSDPEIIKRRLNMSKKAFKRAVGRLLKLDKIELKPDAVALIPEGTAKGAKKSTKKSAPHRRTKAEDPHEGRKHRIK